MSTSSPFITQSNRAAISDNFTGLLPTHWRSQSRVSGEIPVATGFSRWIRCRDTLSAIGATDVALHRSVAPAALEIIREQLPPAKAGGYRNFAANAAKTFGNTPSPW